MDVSIHHNESPTPLEQCTLFRNVTQRHPARMVTFLTASALVIAAAALAWACLTPVDLVVVGKGQVRSKQEPVHIVNLFSSQWVQQGAGNRVNELLCREGQAVKSGDVLFRFSCDHLHHELEKIRNQIKELDDKIDQHRSQEVAHNRQSALEIARATSELARIESQLEDRQHRQSLKRSMAETTLKLAEEHQDRVQRLARAQAISKQEVSRAEADVQLARDSLALSSQVLDQSEVEVARMDLKVVRQTTELRRSGREATLQANVAHRDRLAIRQKDLVAELQHAQLVAPISGVITQLAIRPGATVQPGQTLAVITPEGPRVIRTQLPANDIERVRVGCRAKFRSDSGDGMTRHTFTGRVVYVAPDARSAIASQTELGSGNFDVHIQLVPKSDHFEDFPIRLGMTGLAEVVVDRQPLLRVLTRGTKSALSF